MRLIRTELKHIKGGWLATFANHLPHYNTQEFSIPLILLCINRYCIECKSRLGDHFSLQTVFEYGINNRILFLANYTVITN